MMLRTKELLGEISKLRETVTFLLLYSHVTDVLESLFRNTRMHS